MDKDHLRRTSRWRFISPIGVHAAITAQSLQTAITIQATPTAVVTLRGLAISGLGGIDGIKVNIIGDLHIANCVVSNFSFKGIHFAFAHGRVFVSDSVIRENGGEELLVLGIDGSNQATVLIDHCRIVRNALGGPYGGVDARDFDNAADGSFTGMIPPQ